MTATGDPIVSPPPPEIPLKNPPLVRVIAQVRFPSVLSVETDKFVAPFQEAVRNSYQELRPEMVRDIRLAPDAAVREEHRNVWRFSSMPGGWRLSLAQNFLALETTAYASRADFFGRFEEALVALAEHIKPAVIDRLGVRYIDRITGAALNDIAQLVRPEVRGIAGTEAAKHLQHSVCESRFIVDKAEAVTRWGQLPAHATVDPAAVEPLSVPSWLLDVDMSTSQRTPFSAQDTGARAREFAERIYTIFRWAVTDEFLKHFGGEP